MGGETGWKSFGGASMALAVLAVLLMWLLPVWLPVPEIETPRREITDQAPSPFTPPEVEAEVASQSLGTSRRRLCHDYVVVEDDGRCDVPSYCLAYNTYDGADALDCSCHTVASTDLMPRYRCYEQVMWTMEVGVVEFPHWFPHLNSTPTFTHVQCELSASRSVLACTDTPCGGAGFRCPGFAGHHHEPLAMNDSDAMNGSGVANDSGHNQSASNITAEGYHDHHEPGVHGIEFHAHNFDANVGCLTEAGIDSINQYGQPVPVPFEDIAYLAQASACLPGRLWRLPVSTSTTFCVFVISMHALSGIWHACYT
jgi:hypothetical protein